MSYAQAKPPQESQDIRPKWMNVIRRLQSVATSNGVRVLTIRVVVDANGDPLYWLTPQVVQLEPVSQTEAFLRALLGVRD